jgi:hypothetical protein
MSASLKSTGNLGRKGIICPVLAVSACRLIKARFFVLNIVRI